MHIQGKPMSFNKSMTNVQENMKLVGGDTTERNSDVKSEDHQSVARNNESIAM